MESGLRYKGNGMVASFNHVPTPEACREHCLENPECEAFYWYENKTKFCALKKMSNKVKRVPQEGVVSGIITAPCQMTSASGRSYFHPPCIYFI